MHFPFQIIQSPNYSMIDYEFARALKTIQMDVESNEASAESLMGCSQVATLKRIVSDIVHEDGPQAIRIIKSCCKGSW